jgi:predicted PurR-regulated permease PerM
VAEASARDVLLPGCAGAWERRYLIVAVWVIAVVALLFFLQTARNLLVPIALAVLASYALEPIVASLERHLVPRTVGAPAVLCSCSLSLRHCHIR